jgi:catechol 2,3-dioxygenase-like lactoylglutathione lyase family enzyme
MELALFAGLFVTDREAAKAWYAQLFGTPPSFEPNDVESVWDLAENRSVYIDQDPARAGGGEVTLFVEDLDAWTAGIAARGLSPVHEETYDNGVRKVLYRDPDGNEVGFGGGPVSDGADVAAG